MFSLFPSLAYNTHIRRGKYLFSYFPWDVEMHRFRSRRFRDTVLENWLEFSAQKKNLFVSFPVLRGKKSYVRKM